MTATNFVKKLLNIKKNAFRNDYFGSQSFFMSCHFTKIFVHLLIIEAVSSYKLVGWDVATFTCSKPRVKTLAKGVKMYEICSKLTINTVKRRCGDFIVNFEHISHLFLVLLLFTMNI